jgi:hypothetical protein
MIAESTSTVVTVLQILIFVSVGVSVIVVGINQSRTRRKRALDLRNLATRLGFEDFNPNRDDAFTRGWSFLGRLSQGDGRYAFNLLRGTYHEQKLFVFDYHYQTGSGKNTRQHDLTILMLVFKVVFPKLTLQPGGENLFVKMAEAFGLEDDIKFESAEFSRTYRVQSQDKKFAYDVCNPQMIEYLLANHGLQVEIQGPVILLAFEPQLPVAQMEFNLQRLIEIRTRLPEYLFTNFA